MKVAHIFIGKDNNNELKLKNRNKRVKLDEKLGQNQRIVGFKNPETKMAIRVRR